ncbi:MAG TPA: hypothetical protein VFY93_16215 [Planctomycetota bacterium]|nr:hypothetical protein [Planctomycetota bacterium]
MRCALLALLLAAAALAGDGDRKLLEARGIGRDAASLRAQLRKLYPDERARSLAFACVRALGSEDPQTRHEAMLRLGTLPAPAMDAIREAAESLDPEIRRAAMRLRKESFQRVHKEVLLAVLRTVADDGTKGLAEELLGVAPLATELGLDPQLAAALRATLEPADLTGLRAAARAGNEDTRCAAVRALGIAPGAGADEALPWLDAKPERPRLAAALALADRGDPRCLDALLALLSGEEVLVRRAAADALRAACAGGGAGYDPFADADARRAPVEAWRKAIAARPADAPLRHPLPVCTRLIGRTLISLYVENRVLEIDLEGNRTFEVNGIRGPWGVQGLPDGHRLVGVLDPAQALVEYDGEGNEISRIPLPGHPQGFERIEGGNTLVAIAEQNRVVEVAPDGSIPREWSFPESPLDVHVLESGNLLVSLRRGLVVEVDREGRRVWSLGGLGYVATAQRLDNGNTLIAEVGRGGAAGRVAEYDPKGRAVWEVSGFQMLYSAQRLPDGNTLVADQAGVREIAPDGTERWLQETRSFSRAMRY